MGSKFRLTVVSGNKKTGPIAVSTSSRDTCPAACPLQGNGCYAESFPLRLHWDRLSEGAGDDFERFCADVSKLPAGSMFRHNQAGDLPGRSNRINVAQLRRLADACADLEAFTYTHKPPTPANLRAIRETNRRAAGGRGLTVNLSADTLSEADDLAALEAGPVVVVLPVDATRPTKTPAGRTVIVCPATQRDEITCESCGICARSQRKAIVGFPAHGASRRRAESVCAN